MLKTVGMTSLRELLGSAAPPLPTETEDYRIAASIDPAFLARDRSGAPALLVPLSQAAQAVGRSGGGFALTAASRVAFEYGGRRWEQPAAILKCTDEKLADTFLVLVMDIARRLALSTEDVTWRKVLTWVEEWQTLLGRRSALSAEEQLGLWGELWVLSQAADIDRLFVAWRGPERESIDFFLDGIGLEVKASRRALVHHVSQSQVVAPRGQYDSYFLSIWAGVESVRGTSLAELVEKLLNSLSDPAAFLRQLALTGYSLQDRAEYLVRFVPLEAPRWFRAEDIPRVRAMDDGVSHLRYLVTLDADTCLDSESATRLWHHFIGQEPLYDSEVVRPT